MAARCAGISQPSTGRIEKRLGKRKAIEPNSIYRGNHTGGNARVQYGNVFVQGDYHAVALDDTRAVTALDKCSSRECAALIARLHFLADQCTATLQTRHGTDMVAQTSAEDQLLTLLCWLRDIKTIPQQVCDDLPVFKDAFGAATFIDTRYVTSWNVFESLICNSIRERPGRHGLQRVKNLRYRLHDSKRDQIIDPRRDRNSFRYVFLPGRLVSMSMYFDWNEVSYDSCPRCHHEQVYMPDTDTICSNCSFIYRSLPAEAVSEEQATLPGSQVEERDRVIMSPMPLASGIAEIDRPEHFSRICIGAMPSVTIPAPNDPRTTNNIWEQLQANEDFRAGRIDLDALCAELRTKAKATEIGVVVDQGQLNASLKKFLEIETEHVLERQQHESGDSDTSRSRDPVNLTAVAFASTRRIGDARKNTGLPYNCTECDSTFTFAKDLK
ncbi:AP-1-like transcription factor napA [Pseudocercospora fuligena]|uniref:AP-1-like transcription factor napA n=1 Tax=Pseudocercospora fuligena TaxID=685502 RepID=A0A8H6VTF2_9PEZI|nr:AP-1-like transcription factor napA [Pseudocercospora fuligena]